MSGLRVAVAGGGLGGLCLAQGLLRAGADVTVYERDEHLAARRQGYRLHVDARAGLALEQCLPPGSFALFQATCGDPSRRLTVLSERLRVLSEQGSADTQSPQSPEDPAGPEGPAADPYAPATLSTSVNRQTLREVLAAGLDGRLVFGSELTRYEAGRDGVRLHFADGRQADADLLVGADGVGSAVRRQYLPAAAPADTGGRCIYGKTPLRAGVLDRLPPAMRAGFTAVVGGRIGMATGLVRFRQRPDQAAPGLSPAEDYLMWALAGNRGQFGVPDERLTAMTSAELHALSAQLIRSWHPDLRALHAQAAIDETFLVRIRASRPVPAWPPSRVTVLGDAIHAMSPARGSGANTALRDAALLCRTLTAQADLITAVGDYEQQMREYGYAAVAASRRAEAETGARRNRLLFWLYRRMPGQGRGRLLRGWQLHGRAERAHHVGQRGGAHRGRGKLTEAVVVEPGAHAHAALLGPFLVARGLAAHRARADDLGPLVLLEEAGDGGGRVGVGQVAADEHDDLRGVADRGLARLVDRRHHVAGLARTHLHDLGPQRAHVGLVFQVHRARVGPDRVRGGHGVRGAGVGRELELDDPDDRGGGQDDHAARPSHRRRSLLPPRRRPVLRLPEACLASARWNSASRSPNRPEYSSSSSSRQKSS